MTWKVRRSKMDNPVVKKEVIKRLAVGDTQAEIAKDVGLDKSQVCRFSKREDVIPLIEQEQMRLAEVIPDAVNNVKALVREMPKIPPKQTKRRELSYKASTDVLKAAGILPVPVQSQTMINIFGGKTLIVSPIVQQMLSQFTQKLIGDEPLDMENEEDKK
jgi:hypothetical protein